MAYQHFYSRVPARMSLYNKADGFDTFAVSEGVTHEFIERELASYCETKPTQEEAALIRNGQLPPVYCQFVSKSGELVQGCVTYLPADYTGERSAYLIHNLIYSPEDAQKVLCTPENAMLNPAMFVTDIGPFDLALPTTRADDAYPEKEYVTVPAESTHWLLEHYDSTMVKRFLCTLLYAVCGKMKSVFVVLPESEQNADALCLLNTVLQVFPYHMRSELSFATYIGDIARYPGLKIKCIPDTLKEIPTAKGATVNFKTKFVLGLKDEEIVQNGQTVEFLYSLLSNDAVRREFLWFAQKAVAEQPALASLNFKTIGELIFLFRCSSGLYDEKSVLANDDAVLDFYTVYEKTRSALSDEYRVNVSQCFRRYPEEHLPIPKNLFAKIVKIYPTEPVGVRRNLMNVALDMIHTDIMRDKLFAFIKSNYDTEDDDTKLKINQNLCRVFYGGFLQAQILAFFEEHFKNEPISTQDAIVEKVLLSIRTKAIQPQVLEFLGQNLSIFSENAVNRFYETVLEMLPEGDELAASLLTMIHTVLPEEGEERRVSYAQALIALVEAEQRSKKPEHPLLRLLAATEGYSNHVVVEKIFRDWSGRRVFEEYVGGICEGTVEQKYLRTVEVWRAFPDMPEKTASDFIDAVEKIFSAQPVRFGLFDLLNADAKLHERIAELENEHATAFAVALTDTVTLRYVDALMYDVFRRKDIADGMERLFGFVDCHPVLQSTEKYRVVVDYRDMTATLFEGGVDALLEYCDRLPADKVLRQNVAAYMKATLLDSHTLESPRSRTYTLAICNYLREGTLMLNVVYDIALTETEEAFAATNAPASVEEQTPAEEAVSEEPQPEIPAGKPSKAPKAPKPPKAPRVNPAKEKEAQWKRASDVFADVLAIGNSIGAGMLSPQLTEALYNETSGLAELIGSYRQKWGNHGQMFLKNQIESFREEAGGFREYLVKTVESTKPQKQPKAPKVGGGFLDSVLGIFKKRK